MQSKSINLTWEKFPPEKGLLRDGWGMALLQDPTVLQTLSFAYVYPVGVFVFLLYGLLNASSEKLRNSYCRLLHGIKLQVCFSTAIPQVQHGSI